MTGTGYEFDSYAEIRAALANPDLVPVAPSAGPGRVGDMAWLRATVARFCTGDTHARRRALVEADLAGLDPAVLRATVATGPPDDPRLLTVRALATALGLVDPDAVRGAVVVVAGAYFGGEHPDADAAVAWLLPRMGVPVGPAGPSTTDLEAAANRIGLLVQACDATGTLVEHAERHHLPHAIDGLLTETLRHDPPVRALRRVAVRATRVADVDIAEGALVVLDVAAANRDPDVFPDPDTFDPGRSGPPSLTFGSAPRACPAIPHALALAAGILDRTPPADTRTSHGAQARTSGHPGGSEKRASFADLHRAGTPLLLPNAWDSASASALAQAGFAAIGTTSLGVAAAAGLRDGAATNRDVTIATARRLGGGPYLLSVDAEGGFSDDPAEVAALARELADAGAVGINLEDGRSDGTLTPVAVHAAKIAAVKAAVPDLFVNARTDTYWLDGQDPGGRQDETVGRLDAYQRAGADGVFVPGLSNPAAITALLRDLDVALNVLYTPSGPTLAELGALGVRRVSLGSLLFRIALGAALTAADEIRASRPVPGAAPTYTRIQDLARG